MSHKQEGVIRRRAQVFWCLKKAPLSSGREGEEEKREAREGKGRREREREEKEREESEEARRRGEEGRGGGEGKGSRGEEIMEGGQEFSVRVFRSTSSKEGEDMDGNG